MSPATTPSAKPFSPSSPGTGAATTAGHVGAGGGALTSGAVAAAVGGTLIGPADVAITGVGALEQAAPGALTFIRGSKYAGMWAASQAAAALVSRGTEVPGHDPSRRALIIVDNADVAMAVVLGMLAPAEHGPAPGIHPSAVVDPSAQIGQGVRIGPHCIVGPRCRIGDGTVLHGRVTLGAQVVLGPMCTLHPGVVVYDRCTLGAKVVLHGNVVIGADGFGYVPDPQGRGLIKVPHIGTVEVGNAVEIGACSCVDRGKFGATVIGDGTKIDNHVQIGHNSRIGRACIICGMTGVAGSVELGDGVVLAGHVGVADNIKMGPRSTATAKAGVLNDVPAGVVVSGLPAHPHRDKMREWSAGRMIGKRYAEFRRLLGPGDGE